MGIHRIDEEHPQVAWFAFSAMSGVPRAKVTLNSGDAPAKTSVGRLWIPRKVTFGKVMELWAHQTTALVYYKKHFNNLWADILRVKNASL